MKKTYSVPEVSCDHCIMAITNAVKPLEGVKDVEVDLEKKQVTVDFEEGKLDTAKLIEAIEDAGYDVEGEVA